MKANRVDPFGNNVADEPGREIVHAKRGLTPFATTLAAGVAKRHQIPGDWIQIKSAPVDDLYVRFDDGERILMSEGDGMRRYYQTVEFESATGQAITVWLGFGNATASRATANVNVASTVEPGNTGDNGGDVSCLAGAATQLLAADTDRVYAVIVNPSTNSVTLRIGTAAVDATSGIPLEPGQTLPYASTSAVFAWNPSGGAVTLSAAAVKRV